MKPNNNHILEMVTTINWTPDMGHRLKVVRYRRKESLPTFAKRFQTSIANYSMLERGQTKRLKLSTAEIRTILMTEFEYVVLGQNANHYNETYIHEQYWEFVLRTNRKNGRAKRQLLKYGNQLKTKK